MRTAGDTTMLAGCSFLLSHLWETIIFGCFWHSFHLCYVWWFFVSHTAIIILFRGKDFKIHVSRNYSLCTKSFFHIITTLITDFFMFCDNKKNIILCYIKSKNDIYAKLNKRIILFCILFVLPWVCPMLVCSLHYLCFIILISLIQTLITKKN